MNINQKSYVNELFFIYGSRPAKEISEPVEIDKFKQICQDRLNFPHEPMLNIDKLNKMYKEYVNFFTEHSGNFKNTFQTNRIKPYLVFSQDMWENTKSTVGRIYYTNRCYKEEYIDDLIHQRQNTVSKDKFKEKYGDDWETQYNDYQERRNETYKNNPNIDEINQKKTKNFKYEYFLDKINPKTGKLYTLEEAKSSHTERLKFASSISNSKRKGKKGVTCRSVEYWLKRGLSEEEAVKKVKEIQTTNTVDNYIKKYGEQDGIRKFLERKKQWSKSMMEKKVQSSNTGCSYSKSSRQLFEKVIDVLNKKDIHFDKIYYGEHEFGKWDHQYKRPYFYDFVIPDIKFCVEYNGLMFHPKEGDTEWKGLYTNQSYDEKLNYDKQKMKTLTDAGFTTMVVWEDEDETIMVKKITEKIVDLLSLSI
jgi:hypothetical protein